MTDRIILELDRFDAVHVRQAMEERAKHSMPDSEEDTPSNDAGALIAEICRGWMEFMRIQIRPVDGGEPWPVLEEAAAPSGD